MSDKTSIIHTSDCPYDSERINAAAVYCSDGRWGEQFDDLLHNTLNLPRYDRLSVPGGAACLATHFSTYREEEGVMEQLKFLIETHALQRVVLIAHEHCGFYTKRLNVSPLQVESRQREDLKKALRRVAQLNRGLRTDAFFARLNHKSQIQFENIQA